MVLCFSLVGHEQKVGHKISAHVLWPKEYVMLVNIVVFQITDSFTAEETLVVSRLKLSLLQISADTGGKKYLNAQLHTSVFHSRNNTSSSKESKQLQAVDVLSAKLN